MVLAWRESVPRGAARISFFLLWIAFAVLLLRPHQDAFIGVDTSCYRHMTHALSGGRPLHAVDEVLLEAPEPIRRAFLLMPDMRWRNSRDRSFELMSVRTGETQPFFYPLLPLAASGFDALLPGRAADYLLPLLALGFVASFLLAGVARGGCWGLFAGAALLLGSPFPAWFFRGYFPEVLGAILIAGVLLQVLLRDRGDPLPPSSLLPLGLAVSLHPLLVILALPTYLFAAAASAYPRRRWVAGLAWLLAGTVPLWAMTEWICQPYGRLLDVEILWRNIQVSGEHRMVMLPALGLAVVGALFLLVPRGRLVNGWAWMRRSCSHPFVRLALCGSAALPLAASLRWGPAADVVRTGLRELLGGAQVPLLVLALVLSLWIAARGRAREWSLLTILMLLLPVFLYLKGVEQVGLWSQRRIAPWVVLALAGLLPGAALFHAPRHAPARRRIAAYGFAGLLLLAAGLHNIARWPAPYIVRFEAGADDWITRLRGHIGNRLAFFDYHSYSFPLAVDGRTRVLGLGERAHGLLGPVIDWLADRAAEEPVLIVTAFSNPGLEHGFRLEPLAVETAAVSRIRSRAALPAQSFSRTVRAELMTAQPLHDDDRPPALHKVFDGGPLALRGEWWHDLRRLRNPRGEPCTAQWSRRNSALVGPAPRPGEALRISVQGISGRRTPGESATLYLETEAGERSPTISFDDHWTDAVIEWSPSTTEAGRTAVYQVRTGELYNPARDRIRGFPSDLGVLLHRMDIELISAHTPPIIHE